MYAKLDEVLKKLNTPVVKSDIVRKHLGNRNLHLSQYGVSLLAMNYSTATSKS